MRTKMRATTAGLSLAAVVLAAAADRPSEIQKLPACEKSQPVSTAGWVRIEQREGFSFRLPACFEPDPEKPRFVHGGQRWRCGAKTVEVVWGMWGLGSFDERRQCKATLAGVPVLVAQRTGEGVHSVLVWYLTGTVHEPIVSAFGGQGESDALLATIALSGERTVPRGPDK